MKTLYTTFNKIHSFIRSLFKQETESLDNHLFFPLGARSQIKKYLPLCDEIKFFYHLHAFHELVSSSIYNVREEWLIHSASKFLENLVQFCSA